jgi:hypothetical protein
MDPFSMLMGGGGPSWTDTATASANSTGDFVVTGGGGSLASSLYGNATASGSFGNWKTWLAIGGAALGVVVLGVFVWKLLRK